MSEKNVLIAKKKDDKWEGGIWRGSRERWKEKE